MRRYVVIAVSIALLVFISITGPNWVGAQPPAGPSREVVIIVCNESLPFHRVVSSAVSPDADIEIIDQENCADAVGRALKADFELKDMTPCGIGVMYTLVKP